MTELRTYDIIYRIVENDRNGNMERLKELKCVFTLWSDSDVDALCSQSQDTGPTESYPYIENLDGEALKKYANNTNILYLLYTKRGMLTSCIGIFIIIIIRKCIST